jgi:hypothetical protein
MFLKKFPPPDAKPETKIQPNTLDWWRKQQAKASKGLPISTYRIPAYR